MNPFFGFSYRYESFCFSSRKCGINERNIFYNFFSSFCFFAVAEAVSWDRNNG